MCTGLEILMAGGAGLQALGSIQQGNAAAGAAKYNAIMADANAEISRKQAFEDERRFRVASRQRLGAMKARIGASGGALDGSALDVLQDAATRMEEDAISIRTTGELRALGYEGDSQLQSMYGKSQKQAGYYGAAAELLGGASDIGTYRAMKRT